MLRLLMGGARHRLSKGDSDVKSMIMGVTGMRRILVCREGRIGYVVT